MDLEGIVLTLEERELLKHPFIAGVVLFSRNYADLKQLKILTSNIKKTNPELIIAVDQEGGRVQRFREGFEELPSMRDFGERYRQNSSQTQAELKQAISSMLLRLKEGGIDLNLIPVLDVDHGVSAVIGERSFGNSVEDVIVLANVVIEALREHKMPALGKHFPGHGGVAADSHQSLPVDVRSRDEILADMFPYRQLSPKLGAVMTAHVIYPALDSKPATFSSFWLKSILRKELNFNSVIFSDDLNMQGAATMGTPVERTQMALEAGCDCVLWCNNPKAVISVLEAPLKIESDSVERVQQFRQRFGEL